MFSRKKTNNVQEPGAMLGDDLDDDMRQAFEQGRSNLNRPGSEYNVKMRKAISIKSSSVAQEQDVGRHTEAPSKASIKRKNVGDW